MIDCGYTQLEKAKTKGRLFFYFIENKGVGRINAVDDRVKSCGCLLVTGNPMATVQTMN